MIKTLECYFKDCSRSHVIFNKYTIDDISGVVRKKTNESIVNIRKNTAGYNIVNVYDDYGKRRTVYIGPAILSTFVGRPTTSQHTADHIDRTRDNDTIDNLRWADGSEQCDNRSVPETYKSAFFIVRNGIEKTFNEWFVHLKDQKNSYDREYTKGMIAQYARRKQHGFSYKEYIDLPGEEWRKITWSDTKLGHWEISNMNRVKNVTKHAENVFSGERLCLTSGYPKIHINNKDWYCHILSYMMFFPEEYAAKKPGQIVLHEDDDRLDFRPQKLRLGTRSENGTDAHDNGCYDETKSKRMKCTSYVDDVFEKEHQSQSDAVKYLKLIGFDKAHDSKISAVLSGKRKSAYGRTWKLST